MIPKRFSRQQVIVILAITVFFFYFWRKDINGVFDVLDAYVAAHPTEIQFFEICFMATGIAFIVIFASLVLVIGPWRDRRALVRIERHRVQAIVEALEKARPQIAKIEEIMESASLMFSHEDYTLNVHKWSRDR